MTLPAFAAERRTATPLLLGARARRLDCCRCAVQQLIDISFPPGAQQQTRSSGVQRANDWTDGQTIQTPELTSTQLN